MARPKSSGFTETEWSIMEVLWNLGEATSDTIRKSMAANEERKDSTVRTLLSIMEKKGYVDHKVRGRTFVYNAQMPREKAAKSALKKLLDGVFRGSPTMLMECLLDEEPLTKGSDSEKAELRDQLSGFLSQLKSSPQKSRK